MAYFYSVKHRIVVRTQVLKEGNTMFGKSMGNMAGMMKKVQKMQADMKKMQEELKTRTVEASVGGGAVTVVMNG